MNDSDSETTIQPLVGAAYTSPNDSLRFPPGSRVAQGVCGHRVWLSPSGLRRLNEQPELVPACDDCYPPTRRNVEGSQMSRGTVQELLELGWSPAKVEWMKRELGVRDPDE